MLRKLMKKIRYGFYDSESFCRYLKKRDVEVGEGTFFFEPEKVWIDLTRPYGLHIGKNVVFLREAVVLTHGFDWCVLKGKYGEVLGSFGEVVIGNNVCICDRVTILKNVHICDDVIIGANSTVTSDCLRPGVYAGTPAKYICSLDDYEKKRKAIQIDEAYQQVKSYFYKYKMFPPKEELHEFFYLFEDRNIELIDPYKKQMHQMNNYKKSFDVYNNYDSILFSNYKHFLEYCEKRIYAEKKDEWNKQK